MINGPAPKPPLRFEEFSTLTDGHWDLLLLADPEREMVLRYIHRGWCFQVTSGDKLRGVAVLLAEDVHTIELMNIAVAPEHHGTGIGKALLRHLIDAARDEGYRYMSVGTGNWPVATLAFYQRAGFRIVSIEADYFLRHYPEPIVEDGIPCRDRINLQCVLTD